MEIRRTGDGYVADTGFGEIPLPTLRRLRNDTIEFLLDETGKLQQEAANLLGDCELGYAVAKGKDDLEWLIEIVITAPGAAFAILNDPAHPLTELVMAALLEVCPDLGSSRVVRM